MPGFSVVAQATLCAWILLACSPRDPAPPPPRGEALVASMQATTGGSSVAFVLQVTNTSDAPVTLNFSSGQSFDFVVRQSGREVWRWSADQMFTQALRTEVLAPGETRRFSATWTPPTGASGEYEVTGVVTSSDHPVEQSARFRIS